MCRLKLCYELVTVMCCPNNNIIFLFLRFLSISVVWGPDVLLWCGYWCIRASDWSYMSQCCPPIGQPRVVWSPYTLGIDRTEPCWVADKWATAQWENWRKKFSKWLLSLKVVRSDFIIFVTYFPKNLIMLQKEIFKSSFSGLKYVNERPWCIECWGSLGIAIYHQPSDPLNDF